MLVGPLLNVHSEKVITPNILQEILEDDLSWRVPLPVAESLLMQLAKRKYVEREDLEGEAAFFVTKPAELQLSKNTIEQLIVDFRNFVEDKSLLPRLSDDEIIELFVARIFDIIDAPSTENESAEADNLQDRWKSALVSDYVLRKTEKHGALPPLMKKLAELCMLREVVENYVNRKDSADRSALRVFLDSPVALSLIGASGATVRASSKALVENALSIGVRFFVLPPTIDEMRRNLSAVINTNPRDRHGGTGSALRRGDVKELTVRDMQADPEKYLRRDQVEVLNKTLEMFPNEHRFFPREAVDEFEAKVIWVDKLAAIEHDADLLAITVRSRAGSNQRNTLRNRYSAVTENDSFVRAARDFCLERFYINESHSPPLINLRNFSASVWLAVGFDKGEDIPSSLLLRNCERMLSHNRQVFEKATALLDDFSKNSDEDLALLLQDRNCVDTLIGETYNNARFLNNTDVAYLAEKIRKSVAADVRAEERARAEIIREEAGKEAERLAQEAVEASAAYEAKLSELQSTVISLQENTQAALRDRDVQLESLSQKVAREKELERAGVADRVDALNGRFRERLKFFEYFEAFFGVVASALLAFSQVPWALWVGLFVLIGTFFFGVLAYNEIGPPGRIKRAVRQAYLARLSRSEFSEFERQRWGISEGEGEVRMLENEVE